MGGGGDIKWNEPHKVHRCNKIKNKRQHKPYVWTFSSKRYSGTLKEAVIHFLFYMHDCIIWRCLFILSFHWNWVLNCFSVTWYTLIFRNCKVATMSFNITIFIITIILRTICNKKPKNPNVTTCIRWCVCWLKISQKVEYFSWSCHFWIINKRSLEIQPTGYVFYIFFQSWLDIGYLTLYIYVLS